MMPRSKSSLYVALRRCIASLMNLMRVFGHVLICSNDILPHLLTLLCRWRFWKHWPNILVVIIARLWFYAGRAINVGLHRAFVTWLLAAVLPIAMLSGVVFELHFSP